MSTVLLFAAGLIALVLGATALVRGASRLALRLGLSPLVVGLTVVAFGTSAPELAVSTGAVLSGRTVIGLTIVAAGTSLPEVAASVTASLKGERDIAVGNVVGSCVFNLFGVVGLAASLGAAGALPVPADLLSFDLWVMLAALVACLPVFLTGREIARWEGMLFLGYYAAYTAYLVLAAQRHDGAEAFADAMLGFVVPLTIVTLGVSLVGRSTQKP
jgi:cation:H+ antiporter